ncbi:aminotransferase class I/II-fold pyridoxal phosphate-dependent enzyme [Kitasatospora sp. NPDC048365]|uniref:aminotransferase class I/II-fold pyridoxal phosphate-dependent enzyme n=1 Tax=Kitasatospora sp. NPDC048365 TaxID=3364050 RepID=UPI0037173E72
MVSRIAQALLAESPAIAEAHFRAEACPYHPDLCPDGYLNLGTAENRLVWDLLAERLESRPPLHERDTRYAPLHGTAELRHRIAGLLSRLTGTPLEADGLAVVAGASAALDAVAAALCDPGDVIVVPAPYYGAFDTDLAGRSGARLVPAVTDGGEGLPQAVDRALERARRSGAAVRAVALSSPCNPTGEVYSAETLEQLLAVARAHGADVIADEIYAGSVFGPTAFTTLAGRPGVHQVWGFAKDFGLPGLKVGVLHSSDPEVVAAVRALAYFAPVATDTQALLAWLLSDVAWTDAFLAENRRRLAASYTAAAGLLDAHGIPYAPAGAGFSIWADLEPWLPTGDRGGERVLWRRLFERARVSLTPGEVFHASRPGRFRLCHTLDPAVVKEALTRLAEHLGEPQHPRSER